MAELWYVLRHRPGPAVPAGTSVFEHASFAEHAAFLRRRVADGSLVAAGPLPETDGEGMTVLRAASLADATALATGDDASVVAGVFTVTVEPWQVVMAGEPD